MERKVVLASVVVALVLMAGLLVAAPMTQAAGESPQGKKPTSNMLFTKPSLEWGTNYQGGAVKTQQMHYTLPPYVQGGPIYNYYSFNLTAELTSYGRQNINWPDANAATPIYWWAVTITGLRGTDATATNVNGWSGSPVIFNPQGDASIWVQTSMGENSVGTYLTAEPIGASTINEWHPQTAQYLMFGQNGTYELSFYLVKTPPSSLGIVAPSVELSQAEVVSPVYKVTVTCK